MADPLPATLNGVSFYSLLSCSFPQILVADDGTFAQIEVDLKKRRGDVFKFAQIHSV